MKTTHEKECEFERRVLTRCHLRSLRSWYGKAEIVELPDGWPVVRLENPYKDGEVFYYDHDTDLLTTYDDLTYLRFR